MEPQETRVQNPFADERPQLVHFEKDESHYEACRMKMRDIENTHRRTFFVNTALCMLVCLLSVFRVYIAGFDMLSTSLAEVDDPGAILTGGIFQILFGMVCILMGYLAWANWHTLNLFLAAWYFFVTGIGIWRGDYVSAVIGTVGLVFYFFSIREMRREESLSEMEGYPDFQEKFDISKSDIVIQTLLAHKGERRTKSTLFTTDYSLRRKKKSAPAQTEDKEKDKPDAGAALAETITHLTGGAAKKPAEAPKPKQKTELRKTVPAAQTEPVMEAAPEPAAAPDAAAPDAAAEIIAEAEARAQKILAEALAKAEAIRTAETPAAAETAVQKAAEAVQDAAQAVQETKNLTAGNGGQSAQPKQGGSRKKKNRSNPPRQ